MDPRELNQRLAELEIAIGSGSATLLGLGDFAGRFDILRVRIKYIRFDIEATRRENVFLRMMLKKRRG